VTLRAKGTADRWAFFRRVTALARKETLHVLRDVRVVYMAFGMPILLLLLFGYAVSFDLDRLPIALIDRDQTPASRAYAAALVSSGAFVVTDRPTNPDEVEASFREGALKVGVLIPKGYERSIARGGAAEVQVLLDGADGTTTGIALGHVVGVTQAQTMALISQSGANVSLPVEARTLMLFNPAMKSVLFVVPGLIALILAIMAVLLTALTVAREWERGSMEQLFSTPVRRVEVVIGKLLPYLAVGLIQVLIVTTLGAWLFDVPVRGSVALLFACSTLFLAGMLGQGLLISVVTRNQQVATQVGIITSLLPTLLLSGFLFPVENMPVALQVLATILPSTHFIVILRGILLKGNGLLVLWPHMAALTAFALVMIALSTFRFRRRLA
jgi:ABC-2 type transport system permease protein